MISCHDPSPTPEIPGVKLAPETAGPQGFTIPMPDPGPSVMWYGVAAAVFVVGLVLGILITGKTVIPPEGQQILAPGTAEVTVDKGGRYVLWHEYRGTLNEQAFEVDAKLPDWTLTMNALDAGEPGKIVPLAATPHARESIRGTTRTTLGQYSLAPGTYRFSAAGDFPPRNLQLRPSQTMRYGLGFLAGFGLSVLGGIGGPALAIWIYFRRKENWQRRYNPVVEAAAGSA